MDQHQSLLEDRYKTVIEYIAKKITKFFEKSFSTVLQFSEAK